ncbi:ornithine carbamoyltransferase [Pseudobutyrivibrio sp. 49]|uniref:ornithine carbamoyltransferase n=1 Tax=Pseudobutyrivibrio sp. 49 TaxID=1855344 RepID=UPI00088C9D08|nr:peptide transporter [Pseudobutyrivibrio sp. 49]SDI84410.1 ornithine carbamoyltransferase [Pseudobutyrivibrio sp. 49]
MRSFIRLTDFNISDLLEIFEIADNIDKYPNFLKGKTVVMFFPSNSIRTRVSFEKGIYLLGGQSILFDPATLDKKEDIKDVFGYLQNWADAVVVRHKDINLLDKISTVTDIPVINALTDENHPCEMMSDLYSISKLRSSYLEDEYLFVGAAGNIGKAWKEASEAFGFSLSQCSPSEYAIPDVKHGTNLSKLISGKDIICTDSIPQEILNDFKSYQITKDIMQQANKGALLNPCPPFYRGEEVSENVIDSDFFVGYAFKNNLLRIQQAILIYCLSH